MAKPLNFNNVKKEYLPVTLRDGNGSDKKPTFILVGTPTKGLLEDLTQLQSTFDETTDNNYAPEVIDDLYNACAKIMSRNKTGRKITKEHLEDIFDFEDIMIFFRAYMEFVNELVNSKN